jgi:hypothetical protein
VARGGNLWMTNLAIALTRSNAATAPPLLLLFGAAPSSNLWLTRMAFIGDRGLASALWVGKGLRAYVAGLHPARTLAVVLPWHTAL